MNTTHYPNTTCLWQLILLLGFSVGLQAQETTYQVPEYTTQLITDQPPTIDGLLDDPAWDLVPWSQDSFYQRQPDDTAPISQDTRFKIIYDTRYLYIAIRAYDTEPDLIEARLSRRDGFPGDWVEVNFDSFNDKRTGFSFTTSASGVRGDEFISDDGNNWDSSWDPFWLTKSKIDEDGYTIEARIPFSQLRFSDEAEQEWGLQVNRNLFRNQESSSWAQIKQTQPGWVSRFGRLKGIEGIRPRKPLELQPYTLGQVRTGGGFSANDPFERKVEERLSAGLDGRIGITNDIAIDFTVNPDFGQVEADPGAINLDGFQIFFREQRPFFVENQNIFDYRITQAEAGGSFNSDRLFYSRRVGSSPSRFLFENPASARFVQQPENTTILGATKVSGKTQDGLSIGLLSSITEREVARIIQDGEEFTEVVEPLSFYNVGRVQQDFNERQSTIGVILTQVNRNIDDPSLSFLHSSATTAGIDLIHRWNDRAWQLRVNALWSQVRGSEDAILRTQTAFERNFQRPDADYLQIDSTATQLGGTGGTIAIGEFDGDWVFEAGTTFRTPGLDINDIGFLNTSDRIDFFAWGARRWRNPFSIFNRLQWNQNIYLGWDWGGNSTYRRYNTNTWGQFKNFSNFNLFLGLEQQDINKNILRGGPRLRRPIGIGYGGGIGTDYRKRFNVYVNANWGQAYSGGFLRNQSYGIDFNYQPINSLSLALRPSYQRTRRDDQYFTTRTDGDRTAYLHGSIDQETFSITMRATLNLTPDFTLQYYGQPFIARGAYSNYKKVNDPLAKAFDDRYTTFTDTQISYNESTNTYQVNDDSDVSEDFSFRNPDFNFLQFRSNMVLRWEYRPSSTIFLVWSQGVTGGADPNKGIFDALAEDVFDGEIRNTFLVKVTYRWVR